MATTDGTSSDDTLQASKLRKARETRNLTLQQVAALCDPPITQAQIWKLEKGLRQLTPSWAKRLARALRCEPSEITDEVSAEEWDMLRAWRSLPANQRAAILETINNLSKPA